MNTQARTHLERLREWTEMATIPLAGDQAENQWFAPPLPTRRFGPDAWVTFSMRLSPSKPTLGPFIGWMVLDSRSLRAIAYLERPLADAFGVVPALTRPAPSLTTLPQVVVAGIGRSGDRFFAKELAVQEDRVAVSELLDLVPDPLADAWREVVAADFFSWLAFSGAHSTSDDQEDETDDGGSLLPEVQEESTDEPL